MTSQLASYPPHPMLGLVLSAAARRGRSFSELLWFAEVPSHTWQAVAAGVLPLTLDLADQLAAGAGTSTDQLVEGLTALPGQALRDGLLAMSNAASVALVVELRRAAEYPYAVGELPLLAADVDMPRERLAAAAGRLLVWKQMAACWLERARDVPDVLAVAEGLLPLTVPLILGQTIAGLASELLKAATGYHLALWDLPPATLAADTPLYRVVMTAAEREWALARQLQALLPVPELPQPEAGYVL